MNRIAFPRGHALPWDHRAIRRSRATTRRRGYLALLVAFVAASLSIPPAAASTQAPGDRLWATRYVGRGTHEYAYSVATDGQRVYVTGSNYTGTSYDYTTVAYDAATGAKLWVRIYNGPGDGWDTAYSVATAGQRVFVTGGSYGSGTGYDAATIAYDAITGATLWTRRYSGPGSSEDLAYSLATDGQKVFVTGYRYYSSTNDSDYLTVAYDSASGGQLWASLYNGPGSKSDVAGSIAIDGQSVYVTGKSYSGSGSDFNSDYATVAYAAATGIERWTRRYNGPGNADDYGNSVTTDGQRVYVTGGSQREAPSYAFTYATLAYDAATGASVWIRRYNGPDTGTEWGNSDVAESIATDGQRVYVTGHSGYGDFSDYATVAYDAATGARLWTRRYNGPGGEDDAAHSVATDGTGVYVTGHTGYEFRSNYATIAYDAATGRQLWAGLYNGPGNGKDSASDVATDGIGVYVTGFSDGADTDLATNYDYATVAYEA